MIATTAPVSVVSDGSVVVSDLPAPAPSGVAGSVLSVGTTGSAVTSDASDEVSCVDVTSEVVSVEGDEQATTI